MSTIRTIANIKGEPGFGREGMDILRLCGLSAGLPSWFRRVIDCDSGGAFRLDWLDHPAVDGDALIAEPFGLDMESLRDLLAFADRYKLSVSSSATSAHFPTRTVSIFMAPRKARTA